MRSWNRRWPRDWSTEAATSDMFEIQSIQLAQERRNAAEKTFAATMIKDHQKTSDDLKSMISSGDVKAELPSGLDSSHQSEIDKLKSLKGAGFSSRYDSDKPQMCGSIRYRDERQA